MKTVRVGSRDSRLAVIQSRIVIDAIRAGNPDIEIELITMKTTGDMILDRSLDKIGGKGLFVKELDSALLDDRVDITVHSSKDMPMEIDDRLPIVAVSKREDPRDVLVLPEKVDNLRFDRPIGCSSARRTVQLKSIFSKAEVAPIRGNVETRLKKLDSGEYSALVLAAAGLRRLNLENRISRYFEIDEMLPPAGQGIIAVQARAGAHVSFLEKLHDAEAAICLKAERAFVRALGGGCSSPVAAHAVISGENLFLTGVDVTGKGEIIKRTISGAKDSAEILGRKLAEEIREAGYGR